MIRMVRCLALLIGAAGLALAAVDTPEIDASSSMTAVTLIAGGLVVLRAGRRRKS